MPALLERIGRKVEQYYTKKSQLAPKKRQDFLLRSCWRQEVYVGRWSDRKDKLADLVGGERGEFRSGKDLSDPILIRSSGISQPRWIGRKQLQRSLTRCQIKHVLSAKIFFLCIFKMYFTLFLVYNHIPIILDCLQFIFGWLAYMNPSLRRKTSTIMRIHIDVL